MKRLIFYLLFLFVIAACKKEDAETTSERKPEFKDYSTIKSDDWKTKAGTEITVEGYLVKMNENTYKIVNDSLYIGLNTILNDENYLLVQTPVSTSAFNPYGSLPDLNGTKVTAKGILSEYQPRDILGESLNFSASLLGDKHLATIVLKEMPLTIPGKKFEMATTNLSDLLPIYQLKALPENRTKFALLYSGGIDAMQAASWYYNNLQTMYNLLLKQGYMAQNIVVVYKNGSSEKTIPSTLLTSTPKEYPQIPIDYPATPSGLDQAIEHLKKIMTGQKAELFLMTTNHGGGYHVGEKRNYAGEFDSNSDESTKASTDYDEVLTFYNTDRFITDDEFAQKINSLPFVVLKALFLQCFSGGFIHDLRGSNRVLMSATTETEFSWGGGARDLDLFLYSFINPIVNGPNLSSGNFYDLNKDGLLQLNEVFNGAVLTQDIQNKFYPQYKATPQYDDDGDGKPNAPSATAFGSKLTL